MSLMDTEVLVIGAGVLGVSLAYHLSKAGISTTVLEREPYPAAHASGKNAGMIRQLYHHPQLTAWASRSIADWPEEIRRSCFIPTGSLIVGRQKPGHHDSLFENRLLDGRPAQGARSAVYAAADGLLDPGTYVSALQNAADKRFARFVFKNEVKAIRKTHRGWSAVTRDGSSFGGRWVVNAAGAWVNRILIGDESELRINCAPFARHLFVIAGWPHSFMPASNAGFYWDEDHNWYMRLWDEASRLVSICDAASADPECFSPRPGLDAEVAEKLLLALPDIAENLSIVRSWHCFRTYAPDQRPVWGEVDGAPGFFWLAAFGGFGMSTSFAASFDAAEFIQGKSVSVSSDFRPQRLMG